MNKNEVLIIFRYVARLFEYGQRIKSPVSIKIFLVMNIHLLERQINSSSHVIRSDLRIPSKQKRYPMFSALNPSDPTIILSVSFQSHSTGIQTLSQSPVDENSIFLWEIEK
jgi:hypothetical protein